MIMFELTTGQLMAVQKMNQRNSDYRNSLKKRRRIVVKVGSSSLLHRETNRLDYHRIDCLARELADLKNTGRDVILVSSGAAAAGREALSISGDVYQKDNPMNMKQACAAVGQARLMMIYQKFFEDYNQLSAQVLMSRTSIDNNSCVVNLENTFEELIRLNVIPVVNENDSVNPSEFSIGDNDNLSAMVACIVHADLLILLSDVNGLYTDDPHIHPDAQFVSYVEHMDPSLIRMGKNSTGTGAGTGGMSTKLHAAQIATAGGCDMIIVNSDLPDVIMKVMNGENIGTLFCADPRKDFCLKKFLEEIEQ